MADRGPDHVALPGAPPPGAADPGFDGVARIAAGLAGVSSAGVVLDGGVVGRHGPLGGRIGAIRAADGAGCGFFAALGGGALCVADEGAREPLDEGRRAGLEALAAEMGARLALRRALAESERERQALEDDAWSRVNADAALRDSEERYRSLFTKLDSGFCIVQMVFDASMRPVDYVFVEVNPAFERQSGIAGAPGRSMREIAPSHEEWWFEAYGRVALTGEAVRLESRAEALGRYFEVHAFRVGAPGAHRVAILFNDISERRRQEQALEELNETLDRRVSEAVAERERAQEALRQSQKIEAIGQLTGGVAHDFNNLLQVIRGSVELLRRPGLNEVRRARYVDAIAETADRAARLTSQLLAFSRRQALTPETFELGRILGDVVGLLDSLLGAQVALEMRLPASPCHVHADKVQFETAIVNMAINARDAMGGRGRLVVEVGEGADGVIEGEFVRVSLSDTGQGIAPEDLERIFEPFFTTKAVGVGTGLGLSQVIGFAKQSGGEVRVQSELGRGTRFTLYLPRAQPGAAAEAMPGPAAAGAGAGGARILVVDDNEEVGRLAVQALAELGYETALATSADEALRMVLAEGARFDAVLSDVVMPGMSGLEMGQVLRARAPGLPVLLTSGYSPVLAQDAGHGFEVLHKPYSLEQLAAALGRMLGGGEVGRGG